MPDTDTLQDAPDTATLLARLDSLDAAAVGLLEPLIGAGGFGLFDDEGHGTEERARAAGAHAAGGDPTGLALAGGNDAARWRAGWSRALERLAHAALALQLSGLGEVAALLRGSLAGLPADDDAACIEMAEEWAADVIAFCGGHLADDDVRSLSERLRQWPGMAERIAPALAGRLWQDAQRLRRLAPLRRADGTADVVEDAGEPASGAMAVGADELAMLAEAADQMQEEFEPLLDALPAQAAVPLDDTQVAARLDLLEQYADAIERFANAIGYVGLAPVSEALQQLGGSLQALAGAPETFDDRHRELLRRFPQAWAELFRSPNAATAQAALRLLGDAAWAQPVATPVLDAARRAFGSIELVASRRISLPGEALDAQALSLAIPEDADRNVVDNLLRELPMLSAEFGACIERVRDGFSADLASAQRIAHTLKGSANTVGVRGIATLTHRLEDLLQLLDGKPEALTGSMTDLLADAADCLAEMSEAVAGLGPAPTTALALHDRIIDAVAALMDDMQIAAPVTREVADEAPLAAQAPTAVVDAAATTPAAATPAATAPAPTTPAATTPAATTSPATPAVVPPTVPIDTQPASPVPTTSAAESASPASPDAAQEWLRVPASLIERLLAFANEASILLSQAQEQAIEVDRVRATLRSGTDQLQDQASELERLVDIRGLALSDRRARHDFDALELDEYNDLHTVSRRIAESGADGRLIEQQLGRNVAALRDSLSQLERIQVDLREAALQTRMVQVDTVVPRLRRTVRQAARMAGRDVTLAVDGETTAVDAQLLTALIEPIAHLLRNAVDHGIEPADLRAARGKPPEGRIVLGFGHDGPDLIIDCSDDGQGLDLPALRARAIELGLLEADAVRSDEVLARLALLPGLSTRARATQLSGRGIGLDVVEQAVREQRGSVEIETLPGRGTRFRIRVPVRMAALPVMVVRSATHALALSVRDVEQILPADRVVQEDGELRFLVANRLLRLVRLEDVLALPADAFASSNESDEPARAVLEVRLADGERIALQVPEPSQTRSVVVRRLAGFLPPLPGIEGAAVLGDGTVAPVIDLPQLLAARQGARAAPPLRATARRAPVCLVVDDSVSVRRTMELFVRDLGFDADTAADGVEALEHVQRRTPSLVLADLEMPRMNGVELVRALRARPETRSVPVIMITSRSSDKHRQLALDAGVDVFLTKPYTEDVLASHIAAVTAGPDTHREAG